ncbi:MAG: phage terminase large subunit family protein [Patescibacteria group bacterium]|nr:phage terminase large subunit family protein [Patescibacteria group bacterium]
MALSRKVWESWRPPATVRAVDWIPANIVIPEETETPGRFDIDLFPHVWGVLEAIDDPMIRNIYLPWAARLAKTTTALSALIFFAVNAPRPMLFGGPNEEKADDVIESQLYPMLEACTATKHQLRPKHARTSRYVALDRCRIRRSFSGSPSSMAGFPACYGHATELPKWTKNKSTEANPVKLFVKRAMLYPFESKYTFEGTPALKGSCEITALCNDPGTQRRLRLVPCPHCGEFQTLRMGTPEPGTGGIRWEKPPGAKHSERQLAVDTAYYECAHCHGRIEDRHRPAMMRKGVWIAEGQTIDRKGRVHGKAAVVSSNVAFGDGRSNPFGSLYSLAISGWGQLVGEFLDSRGKPSDRQDFANSVEGREWDPQPIKIHAHELAERLISPENEPRGLCPSWSVFATGAIDVQEGGRLFEWQTCAWGAHARGHLLDWNICHSEAELEKIIRELLFPHADGGTPLRPSRWLIDAGDGHVTEFVYRLCRQIPGLFPCKGSSQSAFPEFCLPRSLDNSPTYRKAAAAAIHGMPTQFAANPIHFEINTERSQRWLQLQLETDAGPDAPASAQAGRFTINAEAALDYGLLDQLLAEFPHDEQDKKGYLVSSWRKTGKNEQRDDCRYNRCLAELLTHNGRLWPTLKRFATPQRAPRVEPRSGLTTPDGRPFLITER